MKKPKPNGKKDKQYLIHNRTPILSEEYVVKYRVKSGDMWQVRALPYQTENKNAHRKVEMMFRNEFRQAFHNKTIELISVDYQ